jgi:hypothetical protein
MTLRTALLFAIFGVGFQTLVVLSVMLMKLATQPGPVSLMLALVAVLSNGGLLVFLITFLKMQQQ